MSELTKRKNELKSLRKLNKGKPTKKQTNKLKANQSNRPPKMEEKKKNNVIFVRKPVYDKRTKNNNKKNNNIGLYTNSNPQKQIARVWAHFNARGMF